MDKDLCQIECLSDNERYADLINGLFFEGEQKVRESDLQELDSQSFLRMWFHKKSVKYRKLYRDMIKKVAFGVNFALIGLENQELVHYLMPLRTLEYDAAEYEKQATHIRKRVKQLKGLHNDEFLSGFRKTDRLRPCITIVLYYGGGWNGPKTLHEIIDFNDIPEELKEYVNDYQLHIVEVARMENMDVFKTDLKQIFSFIKYAKNKQKLKELINSDPAYQNMEEDAYDMISACTNTARLVEVKKYHEKGGKVDMCQALDEMLADEREQGIEQGIEQTFSLLVRKKVKKNKTLEQIAEDLEEDIEVIRPIYEKVLVYNRKAK